MIFETGVHDKM